MLARVENTAAKPFFSMFALICHSIKHAYMVLALMNYLSLSTVFVSVFPED